MFIVDRIALTGPGARVHPGEKAIPALAGLGLALAAPGPLAAACLLACYVVVGILVSGARPGTYMAILGLPLVFIATGAAGLALGLAAVPPQGAPALDLGPVSLYWSEGGAKGAILLGLRSLAATAALLALMLSTPANDLLALGGRLGLPSFLVELAALTYRYIAVLMETAQRIRIAQDCRLGYSGLRASYRSLGLLAAATYRLAWSRSEASWAALRARGYEGSLRVHARRPRFRPLAALASVAILGTGAGLIFLGFPR